MLYKWLPGDIDEGGFANSGDREEGESRKGAGICSFSRSLNR